MPIERRYFELTEIRKTEGAKPHIEGHAAIFNKKAEIWGWTEEVMPGAFRKTIKEADVRALFNHDPNFVLGRNTANTLELKEDDSGLFFDIDPPDTQLARDLLVSIGRGDINQASFGFETIREEWDQEEMHRKLLEIKLWDVSPVTFPAYLQTDAQVRSILKSADISVKDLMDLLARSYRGLPIAETDSVLIRSIMDKLENLLPKPEIKDPPTKERVSNIFHKRLELAGRM